MWPKGAPCVMATNTTWINRDRVEQPLTLADIVRQARLQLQCEDLGVAWSECTGWLSCL
jgi:hypothetical protein